MKILEIIIIVVLLLTVVVPMATSVIFYNSAKQSALNAFLEEHKGAKVLKSKLNAWLLDVDDELVDLEVWIDFDSMDVPLSPKFKEAKTIYVAYYGGKETCETWSRRMMILPSESLKNGEIPGVPLCDKGGYESFKLGELTKKDKVYIDSQMFLGLALNILMLLGLIFLLAMLTIGAYSGVKRLCKKILKKKHSSTSKITGGRLKCQER